MKVKYRRQRSQRKYTLSTVCHGWRGEKIGRYKCLVNLHREQSNVQPRTCLLTAYSNIASPLGGLHVSCVSDWLFVVLKMLIQVGKSKNKHFHKQHRFTVTENLVCSLESRIYYAIICDILNKCPFGQFVAIIDKKKKKKKIRDGRFSQSIKAFTFSASARSFGLNLFWCAGSETRF